MKEKFKKIFAILSKSMNQTLGIGLIILGVILPFYLATKGIISETLFGIGFVAFLAAGFLLYKMDDIIEFETKWVKMKTLQKEIYAKAEEVQKLSEELNKNKQDLRKATRAFVESFYLSLQTRNSFPMPRQVAEVIEKNLDILVESSFEDEEDLKVWSEEIKRLLGVK
jgi:hypothetical protein